MNLHHVLAFKYAALVIGCGSILYFVNVGAVEGETDNECIPLSTKYPDMGTSQSVSANTEFSTVWGSFELPGGPCGFASAEVHYNALLEEARSRGGPTMHKPETLPDWNGHWGTDINAGEVVIGGIHSNREGVFARLTPAAQAVFRHDLEMLDAGHGIDPISLCLPLNYPRWFTPYGYREHFLTPGKSLLGSEMMNEFRRIFTDGRPHPSEEWMTKEWLGYSIGFWDNDIMVVWTRGVKEGIMTRGMPRLTDQLEVVERWRKVDPVAANIDFDVGTMGGTYVPDQRMEIEITLYDPSLVEPWHTVAAFYKEDDSTDELKQQVWPHQWDCVSGSNWYMTDDGVISQYAPGEKPDITDPDFWFNEKYTHE
jgi:hypothetical protein